MPLNMVICLFLLLSIGQNAFAYQDMFPFVERKTPGHSQFKPLETLAEAVQSRSPIHVLRFLKQSEDANGMIENGSMPLLHYCMQFGDMESAGYLIEYGADIYSKNSHGKTLLELAMGWQSRLKLEYVLDNSERSQWQALLSRQQKLLHRAVNNRNTGFVEILLSHGWDVNEKNKNGETPLMRAVRSENIPMVRVLVKHKADLNVRDSRGNDALRYALGQKQHYVLDELLRAGVNTGGRYTNDNTALMLAISNNNIAAMKLLLRGFGSDVHAVNKEGETALIFAMKRAKFRTAMASYLLKKGADANRYDKNGQSILSMVLTRRCYRCVDLLLKAGADVNDGGKHTVPGLDSVSRPPLYWAVQKHDAFLFEKLMQAGADINKRHPQDQTTPVFAAVQFGNSNLEMFHLLIKNGAKINVKNKDYWTPLLNASSHADIDVLEAVIKAGANVNQGNWHGWTPLMAAAQAGDSNKVKLLLKHGAKVNARTKRGWTALSDAKRHGQFDVVKILQQAGGVDPVNVQPKTRKDRGKLKLDIKVLD